MSGQSSNDNNAAAAAAIQRPRNETQAIASASSRGMKGKVKNKAPAPVQITAEQLIREAKERELEVMPPPSKTKILDQTDLNDFRMRKRKEFEDNLRKSATNVSYWTKYATWEEIQGELDRARSVWERALDMDSHNMTFWIRYVEMELKHEQINHARNLFDRCVTLLPLGASQMWYKYVHMEESLKQYALCRHIFERWIQWNPDKQVWQSYMNFEQRCGEKERCRDIHRRYILENGMDNSDNWTQYAKFELRNFGVEKAREVYETGLKQCSNNPASNMKLHLAFAKFEEQVQEIERARTILQYAKDNFIKSTGDKSIDELATEIKLYFTEFEKKHGSRENIENAVAQKRLDYYKQYLDLPENKLDYMTWFDYLLLCERHLDDEACSDIYERAIACVPPIDTKSAWSVYIYTWIFYSAYTECKLKDYEKSQAIYEECISLMVTKKLIFSKVVIMFAKFLVRHNQLQLARKKLGIFIGKYPKMKLFREYLNLEFELLQFDRCRKLYEKWLENFPGQAVVWIKYFEMENLLGETERARAILNLSVNYPDLNTPELVWKTLIDFEKQLGNEKRVIELYEQLLNQTDHIKVWLAFANYRASGANEEQDSAVASLEARRIFERAYQRYKELSNAANEEQNNSELHGLNTPMTSAISNSGSLGTNVYSQQNRQNISSDRLKLLEAWLEFEKQLVTSNATAQSAKIVAAVQSKMPERIKKRRQLYNSDGSEAGWEEYYDYLFPDDQLAKPNIKLLSMAKKWKQNKEEV